jgi:hypothetical protein
VKEVLPELPLGDLGAEISVGRRDQAHVDASRGHAADALKLALLQRPEQLDLHFQGDLTDLVQEQGPAVGQLEAAGLAGDRAGEGAALVAEELRLDEIPGDGRAVDADERLVLAGGVVVDRRGHQLLTGARLAGDEHRGGRRRDLVDHPKDPLELGAVTDEPVAAPRAGFGLGGGEGGGGRGLLDDQAQLVLVEGLRQEVEGPELHGLHRGVDGAVSGQDDHRHSGVLGQHVAEQRHPVDLGHL